MPDAARGAVVGKALASGLRPLTRSIVVYGVAVSLDAPLVSAPQALLGVVGSGCRNGSAQEQDVSNRRNRHVTEYQDLEGWCLLPTSGLAQ